MQDRKQDNELEEVDGQLEIEPDDEDSGRDEPYTITEPFDPQQIDISVEVQNVGYLLDLLEDNLVDLNSDFQRSRDLWSASKMSRFIESLIVRLPIPPFYLAIPDSIPPTKENQIQIVDGLQRLSSLYRFVTTSKNQKRLRLTGLELLPHLNGCTFEALDRPIQRAIERAQVTLYLIRPNTPKTVKYIIFNRMNTGGLTLNDQEIRHALNPGRAAKFLDELVDLPSFRTHIKHRHQRMRDQELALRYIAFRLTKPENYKRGVKKFLDDSMDALGKLPNSTLTALAHQFDAALETSFQILGNRAFSKRKDRPTLNKALFDSWVVNLSILSRVAQQKLISRRDQLHNTYWPELEDGTIFSKSISEDTSSPDSVVTRFSSIKSIIETVLNSTHDD